MVTRTGLVVKKSCFPPQIDDENGSRRQKNLFSASNRRREQGSSSKNLVSRLKSATRTGLVVKKPCFPPQIGDENRARRQKILFPASNRRRDSGSSSKNLVSRRKSATRTGLVAKNCCSLPKNGDEIQARRQKTLFPASNRRREQGSSSKNLVSRLKSATRTGLVAKKTCFPPQIGDENRARRQKTLFPASKRRREQGSSPKKLVSRLKSATRTGLVAKNCCSLTKNGDEIQARRQKNLFPAANR